MKKLIASLLILNNAWGICPLNYECHRAGTSQNDAALHLCGNSGGKKFCPSTQTWEKFLAATENPQAEASPSPKIHTTATLGRVAIQCMHTRAFEEPSPEENWRISIEYASRFGPNMRWPSPEEQEELCEAWRKETEYKAGKRFNNPLTGLMGQSI